MNSLSFLDKIQSKRILIAPLNWGLGHASRCIPIIDKLQKNNKVLIGSDGDSLDLLKREFPNISTVTFPSYQIEYSSKSFLLGMIKQSPKIGLSISKELSLTEDIVDRFGIDLIISDHRLGCRDERVWSIILAHQIQIKSGNSIAALLGARTNKFFINQFNECWIPDYKELDLNFAGTLSNHKGIDKFEYIGPLSRLKYKKAPKTIDILIILSGPEPKRTELENTLGKILGDSDKNITCIRGSHKPEIISANYAQSYNVADSSTISELMNAAKVIISRAGYSSIMDIVHMQAKAIMIPTKGQTEQEYLADHLEKREEIKFIKEEALNRNTLFHAYQELID